MKILKPSCMRISIKHLLVGMSLGAVVIFFYGHIRLKPQNVTLQTQEKDHNISSIDDNIPDDIKVIIEPKFSTVINETPKTQVQSIELRRFENQVLDIISITPSPIPNPKPQKPKLTQVASNPNAPLNNQLVKNIIAPETIVSLIEKYAAEYGVDKNMMIGIAKCESGFRENAINGPYAGIYQFVSGTWISNRHAMGLDENLDLRYNSEEAVRTAAFKMSRDGFGAWPVCQHKAKNLLGLNANSI